MTESPRIDELRRRVQKDPTSIAFAQLAEEYRRVGDYQEAVNVCRSGLTRHPSYLSARVTLARALMELEQFNDAQAELETVLDLAPDNLAAIRVLAEIHQRRGEAGDTFQKHTPPVEAPREAPSPSAGGSEDPPLQTDLPLHAVEADLQVRLESAPGALDVLDVLDALTLDLPPAPDFSSWSLDTNVSVPGPPAIASPPDEATIAQEIGRRSAASPEPDPVIDELQRWLAAIVRDRSHRR